ncbi:MAG: chemotaxis protein CheW [Chloroflexota bacterium]
MRDAKRPAATQHPTTTPAEVSAEADARRILEQRARIAARRPAPPDEVARMAVLVFHLGGSAFAVETRHVLEICGATGLTHIPCMPRLVRGVIAMRGRIVAVVDLAALLGLPATGPVPDERVVVLRGDGMEFGLSVHGVDGVVSVPVPEPGASLPAFTGQQQRFFLGISGDSLAVLDGQRLLTDEALIGTGRIARQMPATPEEG